MRHFLSGMFKSAPKLTRASGRAASFEALESRTLLSDTPLPSLADLESNTNAVVRIETNFGDIDIELFSNEAPITVLNFLNNYVLTGKLDQTFFHRDTNLNTNGSGIDILQGGGFYLDDVAGVSEVDSSNPIILENAAVRENVERTIAMARTNAPNSATSQFFFNVTDNSDELPSAADNGYAVFGRVIQGWSVVQTISALQLKNINLDAPIASSPLGGANGIFNETPVTASYNDALDRVREQDLVFVINAEVIKQGGDHNFFSQRMVYPEGNRTDFSSETINLSNPNSVPLIYQVIVRYEYEKREEVIARGTLAANTSLAIPLSVAGQSSPNLVRVENPYAVVVESAAATGVTNALPMAVSATRADFRATTSEEFFNVSGRSDSDLRTWDFARIERNSLSKEFVTWLNLSDTTATITLTFYRTGAAPVTSTYTTEAFRRGGAEVFSLIGTTLPAGVYGLRVTSTQNIVAQLSDWDIAADGEDPSVVYTPGWSVMGTPGGTATSGAIADAQIYGTNYTSILSFVNPGSTVAVITLSIWRTSRADGDLPIQRVVPPIASGGRADYSLSTTNLGIPEGERFTVTYTSGTAVVAGQYTAVNETNRHLESPVPGDSGISTGAITSTAAALGFTNASIDPTRTNGSEVSVLSLFNPFAASAITFNYTVDAYFSDGSTIAVSSGGMTRNARIDIRIDTNTAIKNKAASGAAFQTFTLVVRGTGVDGSTTNNIAGYAQLTRVDTELGTSMTTQGALLGSAVSTGSTIFLP